MRDNTGLDDIARSTSGFSGAELANVVNEAAMLAARYCFDFHALCPWHSKGRERKLETARRKLRSVGSSCAVQMTGGCRVDGRNLRSPGAGGKTKCKSMNKVSRVFLLLNVLGAWVCVYVHAIDAVGDFCTLPPATVRLCKQTRVSRNWLIVAPGTVSFLMMTAVVQNLKRLRLEHSFYFFRGLLLIRL